MATDRPGGATGDVPHRSPASALLTLQPPTSGAARWLVSLDGGERGGEAAATAMSTVTALSPAKINLTLRVLGTRSDGFHEIESLVARIDLCDTIAITPRDDDRIDLTCDDPTLPADDTNLVLRAANALRAAADTHRGAAISLAKRIPAGAGLGGGSSNAATTLRLLNAAWTLGLPSDELVRLGTSIGSDVALFFHPSPCVIGGRGEQVRHVELHSDACVLLLLPGVHCATPAVYRAWDALDTHTPRASAEEVLTAAQGGADLLGLLYNDLEEPAFSVVPALRALATAAAQHAGQVFRLTGSGSALFTLVDDLATGSALAGALEAGLGVRTALARLISGDGGGLS